MRDNVSYANKKRAWFVCNFVEFEFVTARGTPEGHEGIAAIPLVIEDRHVVNDTRAEFRYLLLPRHAPVTTGSDDDRDLLACFFNLANDGWEESLHRGHACVVIACNDDLA